MIAADKADISSHKKVSETILNINCICTWLSSTISATFLIFIRASALSFYKHSFFKYEYLSLCWLVESNFPEVRVKFLFLFRLCLFFKCAIHWHPISLGSNRFPFPKAREGDENCEKVRNIRSRGRGWGDPFPPHPLFLVAHPLPTQFSRVFSSPQARSSFSRLIDL